MTVSLSDTAQRLERDGVVLLSDVLADPVPPEPDSTSDVLFDSPAEPSLDVTRGRAVSSVYPVVRR